MGKKRKGKKYEEWYGEPYAKEKERKEARKEKP